MPIIADLERPRGVGERKLSAQEVVNVTSGGTAVEMGVDVDYVIAVNSIDGAVGAGATGISGQTVTVAVSSGTHDVHVAAVGRPL